MEEWIGPHRPTIPRLLDAAGYRTVACGKMRFQPLRQSHGFQEMVLCEHGGPEYYRRDDYHPWPDPGERHNLAGGPAHRQAGTPADGRGDAPGPRRALDTGRAR